MSALARLSLMNVAGFCRTCGSFRAAVTLTRQRNGPPTGSGLAVVRWVRSGSWRLATDGEKRLSSILKERLSPTYLVVQDMSGGCGAAYNIHIDSQVFRGKRPVQQHKLVTEALGDEMKTIHAVSIKIGNADT